MGEIHIDAKVIGRKKPLFTNWAVPLPPEAQVGGLTLRELIAHVVRSEVDAFQERQTKRQVLRILTPGEIAEGAEKGKIEMGGAEFEPQHVVLDAAVETALQAFEDGLYLVIIDGRQQDRLDQTIALNADSRVTFVRLTMLSGG